MIFQVLFVFLAASYVSSDTDNVLCYYESWENGFKPDDIDVSICTHVNYAFLGINENGTLRLDGSEDILYQLRDLKEKNPDLKLIVSVGGWAEGSVGFSHVAADPDKLDTMAEDALRYLETYDFDGVDIDWEYPGKRDGIPEDRENFINMLTVLRNKLDENGDYLLTTAVCADPECGLYNVPDISKLVDFVNVMTYDLHSAADNKTGENSPLYASSADTEWEKTHTNCDAAINNWLNRGAAPNKITLGLGFYGHGYTLADPDVHGMGAPSVGEGKVGGSYDAICALTEDDGWIEVWDEEQQVPYKYKGDQWIGFDNPRSIALKVQYAKSRKLGGVMMWAVDEDDRDGSCGTKNALLQTIKDNL